MTLDELLQKPGSWLSSTEVTGVVISSRVRLARNLKDLPFPGWCTTGLCHQAWARLQELVPACEVFSDPLVSGMERLSDLEKQIIFERHLISREHAEQGEGSGVVIRSDETVAVMVNEEDHLRLQAIHAGLDLQEAWAQINGLDDELEKHLDYAFSPQLGYLTACPSNVGTGMRASVMLHLPALMLLEEIAPIMKGMAKIGLTVRGMWGEGTDATGNMFQISNQITLGEAEGDMINNLEQIVRELVSHEENARTRIMDVREAAVRDHVGRAEGILAGAHILSTQECLNLLSGLRLGIDLGIVSHIDWSRLNGLLVLTQPAHLQQMEGRELSPGERDEARAVLVRERLKEALITKKRRKNYE